MGNLIYKIANAIGLMDPLHPVLVHITIGTVAASLVFTILGHIYKKQTFHTVARYNANLSLVSVFFTIPMGIVDWQHFRGGVMSTTIAMKLILSGVLLVLLIITFIVNRKQKEGSIPLLVLYILNAVNVGALGFFGGRLVY